MTSVALVRQIPNLFNFLINPCRLRPKAWAAFCLLPPDSRSASAIMRRSSASTASGNDLRDLDVSGAFSVCGVFNALGIVELASVFPNCESTDRYVPRQ